MAEARLASSAQANVASTAPTMATLAWALLANLAATLRGLRLRR